MNLLPAMDTIDAAALPAPPRRLPLLLRCQLLFGGLTSQGGWVFFSFGLIFFWVFALNADLVPLLFRTERVEQTPGTVVRTEATRFHEGGSEDSEGTPIHAATYRFRAAGQELWGVSYGLGSVPEPGTRITVEYASGHPRWSRIAGLR